MKKAIIVALLCFQSLYSTDITPWIGSSYAIHFNTGLLLQRYTKIQARNHTIHEDNTGELFFAGLKGAYENWALELEVYLANTRHRSFGFSHTSQTLRYQFADDIIGDDYSILFGASLSEVVTKQVKDPTFIHHGNFEGFVFASIGKELSTSWTRWCERAFGTLLLGAADKGSPWVQGLTFYEWSSPYGHSIGAGATFDIGLGHNNFHLKHFHGYGPIKYRALSLEGYYSLSFDRANFLKASLSSRIYAKNCPEAVTLAFEYTYIFGL